MINNNVAGDATGPPATGLCTQRSTTAPVPVPVPSTKYQYQDQNTSTKYTGVGSTTGAVAAPLPRRVAAPPGSPTPWPGQLSAPPRSTDVPPGCPRRAGAWRSGHAVRAGPPHFAAPVYKVSQEALPLFSGPPRACGGCRDPSWLAPPAWSGSSAQTRPRPPSS